MINIIENQSLEIENLENIVDEIVEAFALTGVQEASVDDINLGFDAGFSVTIGDNTFWLVWDGEEYTVAEGYIEEDPLMFVSASNDYDLDQAIDRDVFKEKEIVDRTPGGLTDETRSAIEAAEKVLEEKGPMAYLKEELNLSGDELYKTIVDDGLVSTSKLAEYLVSNYGVASILDVGGKETLLDASDDFLLYKIK